MRAGASACTNAHTQLCKFCRKAIQRNCVSQEMNSVCLRITKKKHLLISVCNAIDSIWNIWSNNRNGYLATIHLDVDVTKVTGARHMFKILNCNVANTYTIVFHKLNMGDALH